MLEEIDSTIEAKVTFLGDSGVGKTSIIHARCLSRFDSDIKPTIGHNIFSTKISVLDSHLNLSLWDTAGQERFHSLVPSYLRDSMCTILVADATNDESINHLFYWAEQCRNCSPSLPIIIAVNKIDMIENNDELMFKVAEKISSSFKTIVYVSALAMTGIDELFNRVGREVVLTYENNIKNYQSPKPKSQSSNGCC